MCNKHKLSLSWPCLSKVCYGKFATSSFRTPWGPRQLSAPCSLFSMHFLWGHYQKSPALITLCLGALRTPTGLAGLDQPCLVPACGAWSSTLAQPWACSPGPSWAAGVLLSCSWTWPCTHWSWPPDWPPSFTWDLSLSYGPASNQWTIPSGDLILTCGVSCWPRPIPVSAWGDLGSGTGSLPLREQLAPRDSGHSPVGLKWFADPPKFRTSQILWQRNWK